jgi:hypothetical protein
MLKKEIDSKCRLCTQREETIDHLTSFGEEWALNETRQSLCMFSLLNIHGPRDPKDRQIVNTRTQTSV